jgi:cyanate lyase
MHHYTQDSQITEMRNRIHELEEMLAAAEASLSESFDEIDEGLGRERRLLWTVLLFGTAMVIAVLKATWPGR